MMKDSKNMVEGAKMKHILLDTNFLLIPYQFHVDIFEEIKRIMDEQYDLVTLDAVIDELDKLQETESGRDKKAASIGKQLVKAKGVRVLKTEKNLNTDKLIVNQAKNPDFIVATQDKGLKRLLKANGVRLIVLRSKKYLERL